MKIAGWNATEIFSIKYPQSRPRLDNWRKHAQDVVWKQPVDVWRTFNTASNIPERGVWIFNIGADRLITVIDFIREAILIKKIMTHQEYMRWSNND